MTRREYALLAAILGLLPMLLPLSVDGSLAIMPALGDHFGAGPSAVQLSLSAVVAGIAAGQLVYGPLSDRFGRKPVIVGGLLAYLAAALACSAAASIEMLTGFRFLQGFFACSGIIVARAVIRDLFDDEAGARLFALMMGLHGIMPTIAPGLSSWIGQEWGWRAVFVVMAGFALLVAASVAAGLPETLQSRNPGSIRVRTMLLNYRHVLGNRAFRANTACACFLYGSLFAYFAGAPTVFIRFLELTPLEFGVALAIPMIVYVVVQVVVARFVYRFGLDRMIWIGSGIALLAGVGMVLFVVSGLASVHTLTGAVTLVLAAHAFVNPAIATGAISPFAHMAGTASSLLGFIQFLAAAAMTAIVGMLDDGTPLPMAAGICVSSLGVLAVYLFLIRPLPGRLRP